MTRLLVLDTNILMHDPMALFSFAEHDVFIPMIVLEELDANKAPPQNLWVKRGKGVSR